SPSIKVEIGRTISRSGADFVEGAILGAVGASGADTRILTGGNRGPEAAETLTHLGLRVSFFSSEIGKASTFKMLRSIFSKGFEAVILELLIAGKRAGIEEELWKDVCEFMDQNPFERVAANWTRTHTVAHERRYHEMVARPSAATCRCRTGLRLGPHLAETMGSSSVTTST
ncbi:MAG: NAD(P)-dependent oxidoreductase, partial [bacterium]|nr:NAD(P)-dependent oxidoreductase [bacterium]